VLMSIISAIFITFDE